MKFSPSIMGYFSHGESAKRNLRLLFKFLLVLTLLVTFYSILFHFLMDLEGRKYSWITGLYWTLTVMTTLGFGDITFHTDLGLLFSIVVLMTGVIFLLTLLPFTFIRFFYLPLIEAESRNRAPKELPAATKDHVIFTAYDPVTAALIAKFVTHHYAYVLVAADLRKALELYDSGIHVAVGDIDDPETYRKMRIDGALLVVATNPDEINTNITFTVRELNEHVPIITTADSPYSEDILQMAGSTRVLQLYDMLGRSLATWTVGGDCRSTVITQVDELILAQSSASGTPLVGKTLAECRLREDFGVSVVGIWERGQFNIPNAGSRIEHNSMLVLAGSKENIAAYDDVYSFYHICRLTMNPVLIIGGGRVGQTIADRFEERKMPYLIIEKNPRRVQEGENYILGDAADIRTLQKALVERAPAALLTTHDDATNIYLTKYLRSLRPDMQILSRASSERNVSSLHRAGADFVMSYATLGASAIFNLLRNQETLMLAEGLDIFRLEVPHSLAGKTLANSRIREMTGCSVVAIRADETIVINPDPQAPIPPNTELVLIGSYEAEEKFLQWAEGGRQRGLSA
ncbi:MAG: potassium channel family protein [Desulfatiglandales bacterium]